MAAILLLGPMPTTVAASQPTPLGAVVIPFAQSRRLDAQAGPTARWQIDAEGRLTCRWLPGSPAGRPIYPAGV